MHSIAHTILYPILAAIIFVSMSIYVHISLFHSTEGLSLITSITFSSTAAVYAADHVVDIFDGDWIIILPGITLMAICFIDLIYQIVFQIPVFALPFIGCPVLIGMFWGIPIIPTKSGWKKIKDIPGMKSILIAIMVVFETVGVTYIIGPMSVNPSKLIEVSLTIFSGVFINVNIFDIRDIAEDMKNNVPTLPILLGLKRLTYFLIFTAIFAIILVRTYNIICLMSGSIVFIILSKYFHKNTLFYILLDCFSAILVIVESACWIGYGLEITASLVTLSVTAVILIDM